MSNNLQNSQGSITPGVERIRGSTQVKLRIISVIGWVLGIMAAGFMVLLCCHGENFKDHVGMILQGILGPLYALVGFIAGQKSKDSD